MPTSGALARGQRSRHHGTAYFADSIDGERAFGASVGTLAGFAMCRTAFPVAYISISTIRELRKNLASERDPAGQIESFGTRSCKEDADAAARVRRDVQHHANRKHIQSGRGAAGLARALAQIAALPSTPAPRHDEKRSQPQKRPRKDGGTPSSIAPPGK